MHAHARARWTGRTLRVEIEGWVDPDLTARDADALGRQVADAICPPAPRGGQPHLDYPRRHLTQLPDTRCGGVRAAM